MEHGICHVLLRLVELRTLLVRIHEEAKVTLHASFVEHEPDPSATPPNVCLHELQRLNL